MFYFNLILAFTPRPSTCSISFSCSYQKLFSVSSPCAQHDRPISITKYPQTFSIRHPALSAILCTNCQHCATWRKCESVSVTSLHIPTARRNGVTRVRPYVCGSVFPSVSLRRAISALLPDPLDTFRAFPC